MQRRQYREPPADRTEQGPVVEELELVQDRREVDARDRRESPAGFSERHERCPTASLLLPLTILVVLTRIVIVIAKAGIVALRRLYPLIRPRVECDQQRPVGRPLGAAVGRLLARGRRTDPDRWPGRAEQAHAPDV